MRFLIEGSIQFLAGKDLVNSVVEVSLARKVVRCIEYRLPAD